LNLFTRLLAFHKQIDKSSQRELAGVGFGSAGGGPSLESIDSEDGVILRFGAVTNVDHELSRTVCFFNIKAYILNFNLPVLCTAVN